MENNFRIAIIGPGKAGSFLSRAFREAGIETDVYARQAKAGEFPLQDFPIHDSYLLTLLCVPDNVIHKISKRLPVVNGIIAHISGATSIEAIDPKHPRRGVFYPVMSFIGEKTDVPFSEIPLCLESNYENDLQILKELTGKLGCHFYLLNSDQRQHLHLAAVWAHNFSNHFYQLAFEELQKTGLNMTILKPLLIQTIQRLGSGPPENFQTGPAVRKDDQTIEKHLNMIGDKSLRKLYEQITRSIQNKNDKKL